MYAIIHWLDKLFQDKKGSYIKFLARRGASAQQLLDLLQDLLDYDSNFATTNRRRLFKALIKLSGDSGLHPRCCMLTGLELGEHLAGGSFSDVYKGLHGGQDVAIKMMRVFGKRNTDQVLKEFGREALIWRQLSHPNLLPFVGLYHLQNRLCLVSPWMENGNLQALLAESKNDLSHQILDVGLGLRYLHDKDVVHGDLKAENIFVTPSFRACIADFGLSSIITTISSRKFISSSQRAQGGTIRYQAPELHRGEHNDIRSDIYAFACVAHQLLAGKHPFPELRTDGAVIKAVLDGLRPSRPSSCSGTPRLDGLWILLQDCWEELPEKRPTAVQTVDRLMGPVIQAKTVQSSADWDDTFTSRFHRSFLGQPTLPSVPELEQIIFVDGLFQIL
ncbi:kinase-like domain-containing protein [Mycena leptocephala]|nr:kinase-like domain-containing protein [Mycena leptocephala]